MTLPGHKVNTWLKTESEEIIIKGPNPTPLKQLWRICYVFSEKAPVNN